MNHYQQVVIKTHKRVGGGSSKSIRANPIDGQNLDTSMKVSCSASMRNNHPIGSYIRLEAKINTREDGPAFLYSPPNASYEILTEQEALDFIYAEYLSKIDDV